MRAFALLACLTFGLMAGYGAGFAHGRNSAWSTLFEHGPRIEEVNDPWTRNLAWSRSHWSQLVGWTPSDVKPADTLARVSHWSSDHNSMWYPDTRLALSGDRRTVTLSLGHPMTSEHNNAACKRPWVVRANLDGTLAVFISDEVKR